MKMLKIKCCYCEKEFERAEKEVKRNSKIGRKAYCSSKCNGLANNNEETIKKHIPYEIIKNAWKNVKNYRTVDKLSPFRYLIKCINNEGRKNVSDIVNAEYLLEIWESQKGICPYTGWQLELPYGCSGWKSDFSTKRASVDRIDSSLDYQKGNIQIVCVMANWAKNRMSGNDLIEFCEAVVNNQLKNERK